MSQPTTSLNRHISMTGICSRREADKWIDEGRVKINGTVAQKGNRISDGDEVTIDDKPLKINPLPVYIALHKPLGITSTTDLTDPDNIVDFINHPARIFPIGRLDKFSSGLILLTNDGEIVNEILREENNHEKEYIVTVDRPVTTEFIRNMGNGVPILGTMTRKCFVKQNTNCGFVIILKQGLNRQIRRMCEYFDYRVVSLQRVRIMNIKLGDLDEGEYRYLTEEELSVLKSQL